MNYKKIFKSQQLRFAILKALSFIPDAWMLRIQYWIKMGRWLDLKNPKRFTEKLQWYKLYYRDPIMGPCVDKYGVREYVKSKGLGHILNELYGVYDDVSEIDFDALPNQFVIKTTDGGGGQNVFICKDKSKIDWTIVSTEISAWKDKKTINLGREWAYTQIRKSSYIVEGYLENENNPEAGIEDYKIFCFNGEPYCIVHDIDRYIDHKRNFYDTSWKSFNVSSDCPSFLDNGVKPDGVDEMLEVAKILSKDFPFVRVDLYYVKSKIYFGELTFYPWSGYVSFGPDSFDFTLGEKFKLPKPSSKKIRLNY